MHRIFQRDLCKLRLSTARSFVKVITDGQGPLSSTGGTSLRLDAKVAGLGPLFTLRLSLKNTGLRPLLDVPLALSYNPAIYRLREGCLLARVPVLVPGVEYAFEVQVECVDPMGAADQIRVFVCNNKSVVPAISAIGHHSDTNTSARAGRQHARTRFHCTCSPSHPPHRRALCPCLLFLSQYAHVRNHREGRLLSPHKPLSSSTHLLSSPSLSPSPHSQPVSRSRIASPFSLLPLSGFIQYTFLLQLTPSNELARRQLGRSKLDELVSQDSVGLEPSQHHQCIATALLF